MTRITQNEPPEPISGEIEDMLSAYGQGLVGLDEFVARWKVSQKELSLISGAPLGTVKKWFCSSRQERLYPSFEARYRLTIIHRRWVQMLHQRERQELG